MKERSTLTSYIKATRNFIFVLFTRICFYFGFLKMKLPFPSIIYPGKLNAFESSPSITKLVCTHPLRCRRLLYIYFHIHLDANYVLLNLQKRPISGCHRKTRQLRSVSQWFSRATIWFPLHSLTFSRSPYLRHYFFLLHCNCVLLIPPLFFKVKRPSPTTPNRSSPNQL